jgi:hypothetical protein
LKIWIGSAVKLSLMPPGAKATNVAAPTTISGAVSPMARDSARITPVAMPGIDAGSTWRQIVCHFVAPSARAPSRIDGGTARIASREAMITTGRTSRPSVSEPDSTTRPRSSGPRTMNARPRMP